MSSKSRSSGKGATWRGEEGTAVVHMDARGEAGARALAGALGGEGLCGEDPSARGACWGELVVQGVQGGV